MVINRMMADEMERVKATMTSSGGIKKMLQGSWWLTVTQFCIEGLMVEGEKGEAMANRFAETMLEEVVDNSNPNPNPLTLTPILITTLTLTLPLTRWSTRRACSSWGTRSCTPSTYP